ncbi:MAG TPA: SGNH/GDSL hydrolase family protein [Kiritimatiellia bacterium]|nr:SGNH/GDSL hydrolase family protein [Kiritimatiellia bacterium]
MRHLFPALVLCLGGCGWRDVEADPNALRIMPLGDSITQGSRRYDSYRRPLWHQLQAAGHPVNFVGSSTRNHWGGPPHDDFDRDHEGHWGWTINQILEHLPTWTVAANPDAVLIHLGTNDLFQGDDPETIARELGEVIAVLRGANPRVALFVAELIPARDMAAHYPAVNERIRGLAALATEESPVIIVDQHTSFDPTAHTYDGVHPNSAGEDHLAARWFAALDPWLKARLEVRTPE